jgi:hypothetical protein
MKSNQAHVEVWFQRYVHVDMPFWAARFMARYAGQKYETSVMMVDIAVKTGIGLAANLSRE